MEFDTISYTGHIDAQGNTFVLRNLIGCNGRGREISRKIKERQDIVNHSPTGLSWGYVGAGPHQCALAILADFCDEQIAKDYCSMFTWEVISLPDWMDQRPGQKWEITEEQIMAFFDRHLDYEQSLLEARKTFAD